MIPLPTQTIPWLCVHTFRYHINKLKQLCRDKETLLKPSQPPRSAPSAGWGTLALSPGTLKGTTSCSSPSSWAFLASEWERSAYSSCSRRDTPKAAARRSAECPMVSLVENSATAGSCSQGGEKHRLKKKKKTSWEQTELSPTSEGGSWLIQSCTSNTQQPEHDTLKGVRENIPSQNFGERMRARLLLTPGVAELCSLHHRAVRAAACALNRQSMTKGEQSFWVQLKHHILAPQTSQTPLHPKAEPRGDFGLV